MINCASFLGGNARPTYERLLAYLAERTGLELSLLSGVEWLEQHAMLEDGRIQMAFICGLPYTQKHDMPGQPVALLAAPVMAGPRYGGKPVYFTDVIVHSDSPFRTFADLRGASWAYNGADSNSGYNIPRDHLLSLGETSGYFGRVVESGSHQGSIDLVLQREVDASGIDSIVLETEFKCRPEIEAQLRVVEAIGPCPVPPVVVSNRLPVETRSRLQAALLAAHEDPAGRAILAEGLMERFVAVEDSDYHPVREMARRAEAAGFLSLR